jgi:hypothetical protein
MILTIQNRLFILRLGDCQIYSNTSESPTPTKLPKNKMIHSGSNTARFSIFQAATMMLCSPGHPALHNSEVTSYFAFYRKVPDIYNRYPKFAQLSNQFLA